MDEDQQFCLRWNNHQNTLISVFDNFLESETLVDCTLAAEGQYLKAHKVVLMACSPYLETLLNQHHDKHPILIMKDVKFQELKAMLQYMYRGEVVISPEQIPTFLKAAESLQIKGLTGGDSGDSKKKSSSLLQSLPRSAVPHSDVSNEQKRSSALQIIPQVIVDNQPSSPLYSGDRSISPILRKRRRMHRPSSLPDDYSIHTSRLYPDIHQDTSNNSCDVPPVTVVHSTPSDSNNVPSAESSSNIAKEIKTEDQSLSITDEDGREQEDGDSSNGTGIDDDYRDMMSQAEPGTSGQGFTSIKEEFGIMSQDTPGLNQNQQAGEGDAADYDDDTNWVNRLQVEVVMNEVSNHAYEPPELAETLPYKYPHHLLATLSTVQPIAEVIKSQLDENSECRYICSRCGRSYKHQFHLKAHSRECSQEPMFECPQCTRKFYHSRNLNRHLQNVHKQKIQTTQRRRRERVSKKSKAESKEKDADDDDSPLQSP